MCKSSFSTTFFFSDLWLDRFDADEFLPWRVDIRPLLKKRPQARECAEDRNLPNGDTNDARPMMSTQTPGTKL